MSIAANGILLGALLLGGAGCYSHQEDAPSEKESNPPSPINLYQTVTGTESPEDRNRWDALFSTEKYVFGKEPSDLLKNHLGLFPPAGKVLDLAMGEGRNAVFLARKGYDVTGVDISDVAIRKARRLAREYGVSIKTVNADLTRYQIQPESFDLILKIFYLERSLFEKIKKGLRKGGVLVVENYTVENLDRPTGRGMRRDFLLEKDELKKVFGSEFEFMVYEEKVTDQEAKVGLIARKK